MKSGLVSNNRAQVRRRQQGYTLAETLAALLFLAIVIPAVVEALHVAGRAGTVSVRRAVAARIAEEAGLRVIMDRCVKIEHGRYSGSLHWVGMNTEIISARRGQRYF